ncbi:MAG: TM2 domain-containing protein [Treponema sp.]|jgi:TM2 domain-containing membrane protein YozV|nr:TM2 domain-containing protein [Treponema sp.]
MPEYPIQQKGSDEAFCASCGAVIKKEAEICPKCGVRQRNTGTSLQQIDQAVFGNGNVQPKSKAVAYLLLIFLGAFGAHRFYLEKVGTGILYLFTGGVLGIGILVDLFTLSGQVDTYNILHRPVQTAVPQSQTVVVNVAGPAAAVPPAEPTLRSLPSEPRMVIAEKSTTREQILSLSMKIPLLSVREIVAETHLDLDEVEASLKEFVEKGIAKEQIDSNGKTKYDFA